MSIFIVEDKSYPDNNDILLEKKSIVQSNYFAKQTDAEAYFHSRKEQKLHEDEQNYIENWQHIVNIYKSFKAQVVYKQTAKNRRSDLCEWKNILSRFFASTRIPDINDHIFTKLVTPDDLRYIEAVDSYIEAVHILSREEFLKTIGYKSSEKNSNVRMYEQILQWSIE